MVAVREQLHGDAALEELAREYVARRGDTACLLADQAIQRYPLDARQRGTFR
jgi:hypothetical protein